MAKAGLELSVEEKIELITRHLVSDEAQTLFNDEARADLKAILAVRPLKIYWGTATTGSPHIAYFLPIAKIADFLRAGCEVKILLADLHAFLDAEKAALEVLPHRAVYYKAVITTMLESIGAPMEKLQFVRGTSFQMEADYTLDMYRLAAKITQRNAKKAGAEVIKQVEDHSALSGLLYPLLQVLDEEYLHVDAQFGGLDQRKIFVMAQEVLPKYLGYKKRIHFMNPMVPSLELDSKNNKKMSSSSGSKIDLLDSPAVVEKKIAQAYAKPKMVENNGLLAFVRLVLFPLVKDFVVRRKEEHGGDVIFTTYAEVEAAYASGSLFPLDLKHAVALAINRLLERKITRP